MLFYYHPVSLIVFILLSCFPNKQFPVHSVNLCGLEDYSAVLPRHQTLFCMDFNL